MKNQIKKVSDASANKPKASNSLSQKFHQYIVDKAVNWALQSSTGKSRFSELKWGDDEREILNQVIENPEAADLNLPLQNSKFIRFFKSIAVNGSNTMDIQMFYRYRDQLPLRELKWVFTKDDFIFTKGKVSSKIIIPAGYYMLELGIKTSKFSAQIKFDINAKGQPKSKGQTFELQAKSNQISKRLILLENDSMLQTSLSDMVNESAIYHLRLARLTKNFFLSRMLKKIGSKFDLQKNQNLSEEEIKAHWNKYDSFFKTKYHHADYEYYIRQVEAKQTPTHAQQLRNAQLWMSKKR